MVSQSRPSFSVRISSPCSLNSGARLRGRGRAVELHRRAHQRERRAALGVHLLQVAVGDGLRVGDDVDGVLHRRPLALHPAQLRLPLLERLALDRLGHQLRADGRVLR